MDHALSKRNGTVPDDNGHEWASHLRFEVQGPIGRTKALSRESSVLYGLDVVLVFADPLHRVSR